MRKDIPKRSLPDPIPREEENYLLRAIERRIKDRVREGREQEPNVRGLVGAVVESFEDYSLTVEYAGPYGILPHNPLASSPLVHFHSRTGKPGCSDIDLEYGVIGPAITNGQGIYVPSVKDLEDRDPDAHHECREGETDRPDMSEIVIVLPKRISTPDRRVVSVVQETFDLDIQRPNPLSEEGARKLEELVVPALRVCFPGPVTYTPIEGIHYRHAKNGTMSAGK